MIGPADARRIDYLCSRAAGSALSHREATVDYSFSSAVSVRHLEKRKKEEAAKFGLADLSSRVRDKSVDGEHR